MNIRDMSRKYNIPMDTLRYYEKMELIGQTERNGNRRIYGEKECKELEFIILARNAGMPIDILKKYMIANRDENIDIIEKRNLLQEEIDYIKENMRKEEAFLNKITNKVDKFNKEIAERDEREKARLEREKNREIKLEQERVAKEQAKEEKRIAKEKAKEELKARKLQEKIERKIARKRAREEAKRQELLAKRQQEQNKGQESSEEDE